jgi:hypothetical protein
MRPECGRIPAHSALAITVNQVAMIGKTHCAGLPKSRLRALRLAGAMVWLERAEAPKNVRSFAPANCDVVLYIREQSATYHGPQEIEFRRSSRHVQHRPGFCPAKRFHRRVRMVLRMRRGGHRTVPIPVLGGLGFVGCSSGAQVLLERRATRGGTVFTEWFPCRSPFRTPPVPIPALARSPAAPGLAGAQAMWRATGPTFFWHAVTGAGTPAGTHPGVFRSECSGTRSGARGDSADAGCIGLLPFPSGSAPS